LHDSPLEGTGFELPVRGRAVNLMVAPFADRLFRLLDATSRVDGASPGYPPFSHGRLSIDNFRRIAEWKNLRGPEAAETVLAIDGADTAAPFAPYRIGARSLTPNQQSSSRPSCVPRQTVGPGLAPR
jgi:hypothetical protein